MSFMDPESRSELLESFVDEPPRVLVRVFKSTLTLFYASGQANRFDELLQDIEVAIVDVCEAKGEVFAVKLAKRLIKMHDSEANAAAFSVLEPLLAKGGDAHRVFWQKLVVDKMSRLEVVYEGVTHPGPDWHPDEAWLDEHGYGDAYRDFIARGEKLFRRIHN